MTVGTLINILSWQPGYSGFSSYVRRILPAIQGFRLQLDCNGNADIVVPGAAEPLPECLPPKVLMRLLHRYSLTQYGVNVKAALKLAPLKPNYVYSPYCNWLSSLAGIPQLITCHDLTPLYVPNSRRAWLNYRFLVPHHLHRASGIVAISKFVADQLIHIGIPANKINVVYNGIKIERPALLAPASADLLMLARHDVNKNVAYVIKAFAALLDRFPHWPGVLRVVGRAGRQTTLLKKLCMSLADPNRVIFISQVSPDQLIKLLRASLALVSSSVMEGFDYPVLEAKAEGLPTLLSTIPVHSELHVASSLFFSLSDAGFELQNQLLALHSDPQLWSQISLQGYKRASELSLIQQQQQLQVMMGAFR